MEDRLSYRVMGVIFSRPGPGPGAAALCAWLDRAVRLEGVCGSYALRLMLSCSMVYQGSPV